MHEVCEQGRLHCKGQRPILQVRQLSSLLYLLKDKNVAKWHTAQPAVSMYICFPHRCVRSLGASGLQILSIMLMYPFQQWRRTHTYTPP